MAKKNVCKYKINAILSYSRRKELLTGELQNYVSPISKVCNRSSATFFFVRNSATGSEVHNIAELRKCGLKLWMPTFVNIFTENETNRKRRFPCVCCNGKWKRQTSVCFLQFETENGNLFSLVSKR